MPGDSTWTTHRQETRETREAEELDGMPDDLAVTETQKEMREMDAFLLENTDDGDNMEDTAAPVRTEAVVKKLKAQNKAAAMRDPIAAKPKPKETRKRKLDKAETVTAKNNKEKREEIARRKEIAIMRGGKYYKMRDEAAERDRAMRDAKKNKLEGRETVDKAMKVEDNLVLENRSTAIKELTRRFYAHETTHSSNVALGEITTLVPQHNLGYIDLLGDDETVPRELARDTVFMKQGNRKILFDGTSLMHQSFVVGDIVKFEFSRLFQGTDVTKSKYKSATQSRWIATNVAMFHPSKEKIPFKCQIIPQEVRKYMLSLLYLIEAGADLSLYVKIVQELEIWCRILGEPFTNKATGGLMQWHVLLILGIASRTWLEDSNMHILLWSFFNSFTGTTFMTTTLPLHIPSLSPSVLVQVAQFIYLYKKNTGEDVAKLHGLLRAAKQNAAKDKVLGKEFVETLKKLEGVMGERESFVGLLGKAAAKGYNTLMIKDKKQLLNVDEIISAEREGHSAETDGFNPLPTLDEFAEEDALEPDRLPRNRDTGSWGSPENYTKSSFTLLRADTYKEFQFSMHHKIYKHAQFAESDDAEYKRSVSNPSTWCRVCRTHLIQPHTTQLVGILGVNYVGAVTNAGRLCYTVRFKIVEAMQDAWKMRYQNQLTPPATTG